MITPERRLYDYTRALSSGVYISEASVKEFLPSLYLNNRNFLGARARFLYEGDFPFFFTQAYNNALTKLGESYGVQRTGGENDDAFRQKVILRLSQSPTVAGIKRSVEILFSGLGISTNVSVVSETDNFFDAVGSDFDTPIRGELSSRVFRVSIEINPGLKTFVNNYDDEIVSTKKSTTFIQSQAFSNFTQPVSYESLKLYGSGPIGDGFNYARYRVKKPGFYNIYFDPKLINFETSLRVITRKVQFPKIPTLKYENLNVKSQTFLPLGFLTEFQEILIETSRENYECYLSLNQNRFDFYKNPAYNSLLASFGVSFLREIFSEILSFGVKIERITVNQSGTGG
jgi:hypothetical protein